MKRVKDLTNLIKLVFYKNEYLYIVKRKNYLPDQVLIIGKWLNLFLLLKEIPHGQNLWILPNNDSLVL